MGSRYFTCLHCGTRCLCNVRIKSGQHYCGSRACQQSRKNKWERDKLHSQPSYRSTRDAAKRRWYSTHRGDRYQDSYRQSHPLYVEANRLSQHERNMRRVSVDASVSNIVKTDALNSVSPFTSGFYVILPYTGKDSPKIVKTDALIVELRSCKGLQGFNHRSGP